MTETARKIVVVGDGSVGKTALLYAYVNGEFQPMYVPTVFETSATDISVSDGRQITLGLWDTGGQEEFDQIRQLAYPGASLLLLCYAVDSLTSLENIIHTWIGEVRCYCQDVPIVLVGCKSDKRYTSLVHNEHRDHNRKYPQGQMSEDGGVVDPAMGDRVATQIGAYLHIECSALTRSNVTTLFQLAAQIVLDREDRQRRQSRKFPARLLKFIPNGDTQRRTSKSRVRWCCASNKAHHP